jgi:hypothetical protein
MSGLSGHILWIVNALTVLGYLLEAAGLGLAFYGLHRTFRQYAPGQREFDPIMKWLVRRRRAVHSQLRNAWHRLRRRPSSVEAHAGFVQATATLGATVRGRKGYGHPTDRTVKAVAATFHARTQELLTRTYDVSDRIEDEAATRSEADEELAAKINLAGRRLDEMTRDLAIGGLRVQLVGLSLISFGLVFQGIGQAIG